MERTRCPHRAAVGAKQHQTYEAGFALITFCSLVSLITAIALSIGLVTLALSKMSKAQKLCVLSGVQMQNSLAKPLQALLRLNPAASRLRTSRTQAERRLEASLATGNLARIALAEAELAAVVFRQMALAARQRILLAEAEGLRLRAEGETILRLRSVASGINARRGGTQALAVRPEPITSPSPDYVPLESFGRQQSETFEFNVLLFPADLVGPLEIKPPHVNLRCSITLQQKGQKWEPEMLMASVPLK